MINNIIDQLKRDEGFRPNIYPDSRGFSTVGYGHNLDANPINALTVPISEALATQILGADVERISRYLQLSLPWVVSLDDARHGVLLNMAFNMGVPGELKFHHELADTQAGNYLQAAADMKASLWYNQVGARAQRLCQQMETGIWQ
jgi:lysozyme